MALAFNVKLRLGDGSGGSKGNLKALRAQGAHLPSTDQNQLWGRERGFQRTWLFQGRQCRERGPVGKGGGCGWGSGYVELAERWC